MQKKKLPRRSKNHYVNNKDFLKCITDYYDSVASAKAAGKELPRIPEYAGKCIMDIAKNFALKREYRGYSFVDEMKADGIENAIKYFDRFDPSISQNPLAYFTQIIYHSFLHRIAVEKKKQYTIYKNFQNSIVSEGNYDFLSDNSGMFDGDTNFTPVVYDNINEYIRNFEDAEEKRKEKRKRAAEDNLERFIDE